MKKTAKVFTCVLACTIGLSMLGACSGEMGSAKEAQNKDTYTKIIEDMGVFDNKIADALPQTIIYKLMEEHLSAPLPAGKTVKKAIYLGYDGYRADALLNIKDSDKSAIMSVKKEGGLYHTFSGGVAGVNEQATSTAPSWSAMLSGGWANFNGVDNNGQAKKVEAETFLTKYARAGKAAAFTTSWREHTSLTYKADTLQAIEQGLPAVYNHVLDDAATYYQIMQYVAKPADAVKTAAQDPDAIFFTFEHGDHAGHGTGFGNQNDAYVVASKEADEWGYNVIQTIKNRSTYASEDWLIIVSTDHGGTGTSHGGQSVFERSTWLAVNQKIEISDENKTFARKSQLVIKQRLDHAK